MSSSNWNVVDSNEMTFTGHLEELRNRIFKMLIALIAGLFISYFFIDNIVSYVTEPAGSLYYLRPAEAFFIYIKVGLVAGMIISSPFIFYQLWAFIMPAFSLQGQLKLTFIAVASVVLFVSGLLFSYYLVLPLGLAFFTGFDGQGIQAMISMENYVDFVLLMVLPFGIIFELPLILILGAYLDLITSSLLVQGRRYVIFGSFVLAAILTPPDVISQVLLAMPMLAMYELSILFIKYILNR